MLARPGLPSFDYVRAGTADEVVRLLEEHSPAARLMMGGTDLFPQMRERPIRPALVIDVKHLPGMREVTLDDRGLTVGAAVTMNEIARHPEIQAHYGLLAEAANAVGSYQVRNRATIGGNLCNASPCADTALATLVLEGRVVLYGPNGERELPVEAFLRGPGETALGPAELMTRIHFPAPVDGAVGRHLKLSRNRLGDLSLASVDVWGAPDETDSGYKFRIGLGSVAPTVIRAHKAEEILASRPAGEATFTQAAEQAMAAAAPIDDVRAGATYRRAMVRNLTLRGLHQVWDRLRNTQYGLGDAEGGRK
jgi:carbon-monoxide dehydrogenase medium subunit